MPGCTANHSNTSSVKKGIGAAGIAITAISVAFALLATHAAPPPVLKALGLYDLGTSSLALGGEVFRRRTDSGAQLVGFRARISNPRSLILLDKYSSVWATREDSRRRRQQTRVSTIGNTLLRQTKDELTSADTL